MAYLFFTYAFFAWTAFFASLSIFLKEKEIRADVHMEHKSKGLDRVLEVLAGYPVFGATIAFSFFYVHISPFFFVPAYILIGGISGLMINKIYAFEFWSDKKPTIDVISVISGGVMLFIVIFFNI